MPDTCPRTRAPLSPRHPDRGGPPQPRDPRGARGARGSGAPGLAGLVLAGLLATIATGCRGASERAEPATPGATAPTPRTLRVALCQLAPAGDLDSGLRRVDEALARAAEQGAELACFPEACLLGWVNPEAHDLAQPIPGATTERLAALARHHDLGIVIGLAERDGERLHNSVVLLDRDGTLLLRHRKVNVLEDLMEPPYTAGPDARDAVVETRWGRVGLLICADTFRDELVDQVAEDAPDLVVVPYGWAAPAEDWPGHGASLHGWIRRTATRTGAPVVGVDAVGSLSHGPWAGMVLGGQSAVSDAAGELAAPPAGDRSVVTVVEVALGAPNRVDPAAN